VVTPVEYHQQTHPLTTVQDSNLSIKRQRTMTQKKNTAKPETKAPAAAKVEKKETQPVVEKYISKASRLKLVKRSKTTTVQDGRIITQDGESVQFNEGMFATSDPSEIAFLDSHPSRQREFYKVTKAMNSTEMIREREQKYIKTIDEKDHELDASNQEIARLKKLLEGQKEPEIPQERQKEEDPAAFE
jgi:hypothetical protein